MAKMASLYSLDLPAEAATQAGHGMADV